MTESKGFHSEISSPTITNTTTISQSQVNESFSSTSEIESSSTSGSSSSSSTTGSSSTYVPQFFSSSLNHLNKYLPLISVVIIILASIAIKYLTELELFGLSSPFFFSWGTPVFISTCFLFYSLSLVLISFFISQRFYTGSTPTSSSNPGSVTSASTSSNVPSSLSRLRSHFTFLPLTHFIRQHAQASGITSDGISNNQPLNNQPNNTTLHTNGNSTASSSSSNGKESEYTTRLESQRDALVEAIFESCVNPWYERISNERNFPIQTKQILQATFDRLFQKFHQLDRTNLTKEAIEIINSHWKSYCEASKKGNSSEDKFEHHFSFVHNCVVSREDLSKHYETLLYLLLKEFVTPDLQSNLVCRFLSGILVKSFFLYYVDLITDPKWINTAIYKKLISSDTLVTTTETIISSTGSSQESVFEFPSKVKDDSNSNSNSNTTNTTKTKIQNQDSDSIDGSCNHVTSASEKEEKEEKETSSNNEEKDLPHQQLTTKDDERESIRKLGKLTPTSEINVGGGPTVSAALGGLLSATALPLLPEGTINTLKCLEGNNNRTPTTPTATTSRRGSNINTSENEKDNTETNKTTQEHLNTLTTTDSTPTNNDNNTVKEKIESTDIKSTPNATTPTTTTTTTKTDGSNSETIETPSTEAKTVATGANRHYSLDDHSTKSKSTLSTGEKGTQSLDETKNTSTVMRQEEFDLSFNDRLQIEGSSSTKDVSPCYEEAEDFAATISKLRALLEQRESQKNLIDNMNTTAKENEANIESVFKNTATTPENNGSPENTNVQTTTTTSPTASPAHSNKTNTNNTSTTNNASNINNNRDHHHNNSPSSTSSSANSTTRPSLNSQSSASSLGSGSDASSASNATQSWDSERLEKIVDELDETGPVLNRFFLNVTVPKTEACSDSSGQFILFCIQYEGVYVEENDDGQVKLVLRTTTIKRRFQEFLTLQTQLEESSLWKPHMKGIKPPTKWINLSFSKSLESTNINQRRVALEKYLHQLCYHPVLGFSQQLRNFMAYGEDGFQAFQASDAIPIDRFDKIAKKFTGVFNSLRDALPSFESELLGVPSSPDASNSGGKSPITDNKAKSLFASFLRAEKLASASSTESITDKTSKLSTEILDSSSSSSTITSTTDTKSECESKSGLETDNNNLHSNESSDDNTLNNIMEPQNIQEPIVEVDQYPLAVAATHLLCDVLWLNRPHAASVSAFLSISGKSFENYLQEFLDLFLSQEAFLDYLEQAAVGIKEWMNEDETLPESEVGFTETDLKDCLKQKIPVWVRFAWGRNRVEGTIARLTKVWQETTLNQDLMLSLVELLFSKLIDTNDSSITHGSNNNSSSTTTNGHS